MTKPTKKISSQQAAKLLGTTKENLYSLAKAGLLSTVLVNTGKHSTRYYFESEILKRKKASEEYLTKAKETEEVLAEAEKSLAEAREYQKEAQAYLKASRRWQSTHRRLCNILDNAIAAIESPLTDRESQILHELINLTDQDEIIRYFNITPTRLNEIVVKAAKRLLRAPTLAKRVNILENENARLRSENTRLNDLIEYHKEHTTTVDEDNILVLTEEQYKIRQMLLSDVSELFRGRYDIERLKEVDINTVADLVSLNQNQIRNLGLDEREISTVLYYRGMFLGMNVSRYGIKDKTQLKIESDLLKNEITSPEVLSMRSLLLTKVSDYGLSVRAFNCLKAADLETLADLCQYTKGELFKLRNFGRKSMDEIQLLLEKLGLNFGMDITQYGLVPKSHPKLRYRF